MLVLDTGKDLKGQRLREREHELMQSIDLQL